MKKKYQNAFFIFGLCVLLFMITQLNFGEVWEGVRHAGYWFFAILVLWLFLYLFNTGAWYLIIKSCMSEKSFQDDEKELAASNPNNNKNVGFWWLYKITVSGFALNLSLIHI